jgi:hypothetical protein
MLVATETDIVQQLGPLAVGSAPLTTMVPGPLLQTLGRTQTIGTREVGRSLQRAERSLGDAKVLAAEVEALKGAALGTVRVGQKCYSVEAEVKRLHLELMGDTRSTAATKAIGHDTAFPPLTQVCKDTVALVESINRLLTPAARETLQEFARTIDSRKPEEHRSPPQTALSVSFAGSGPWGDYAQTSAAQY